MSELFNRMDTAHTAVSDVRDLSALLRDLACAAGPKAVPAITAEGLSTAMDLQCQRCNAALQALDAIRRALFQPAAS